MARQVKSGPAKLKKPAEKEQPPAKVRRRSAVKPAEKKQDPIAKTIRKSAKTETSAGHAAVPISRNARRKPHARRPTAKEALRIAQRQELVVDLYNSGATFRQIAIHLKEKGIDKGASKTTVHRDFVACLDRTVDATDLSTKQLRKVAVERLDKLFFTFNTKAVQEKDVQAGHLVLKVERERDRYLNISKAQQSEIQANQLLADLLGIDVNQLPNADDDSA